MNKKLYTLNFVVVSGALYVFAVSLIASATSLFSNLLPTIDDICNCSVYEFSDSLVKALIGLIFFIISTSFFIKKYADVDENDEYVLFLNKLRKVLFWIFVGYIFYYPFSYIVTGGNPLSFAVNLFSQGIILLLVGYFIYAEGKWKDMHFVYSAWSLQGALIIFAFIGGFMTFGTPFEQYKARVDASTLNRLNSVAVDVGDYIFENNTFPDSLRQVIDSPTTINDEEDFKHPRTHKYFVLTHESKETTNPYDDSEGVFRLCSSMYLDYNRAYKITYNIDFLKSRNNSGEYCLTEDYYISADSMDENFYSDGGE